MSVAPSIFHIDGLELSFVPKPWAFAIERRVAIDDYFEKTRQTVTAWKGMNGLQGGDPAKLAKALVQLASQADPPLRWAAGADAIVTFEQKAKDLLAQANAYRELSSSLAHDDVNA